MPLNKEIKPTKHDREIYLMLISTAIEYHYKQI